MTATDALLAVAAGLLVAVVATPVGVSGAVFLLPFQLSVLGVPSPAVTPTNLLYNVVAGPGALLRHGTRGALGGRLTRLLLAGTVPGVVAGAVLRVYAVPGGREFRLIVAALLLPLGAWLCWRTAAPRAPAEPRPTRRAPGEPRPAPAPPSRRPPPGPALTALAFAVGVVGGVYGIGGGALLGPILVGRGMAVAVVAPAALTSTFVTSAAGAAAYAGLALSAGAAAPRWGVGLLCGLGGLVGGYLGAHLQPHLPERALRLLLGALAVALGLLYLGQAAG